MDVAIPAQFTCDVTGKFVCCSAAALNSHDDVDRLFFSRAIASGVATRFCSEGILFQIGTIVLSQLAHLGLNSY